MAQLLRMPKAFKSPVLLEIIPPNQQFTALLTLLVTQKSRDRLFGTQAQAKIIGHSYPEEKESPQ